MEAGVVLMDGIEVAVTGLLAWSGVQFAAVDAPRPAREPAAVVALQVSVHAPSAQATLVLRTSAGPSSARPARIRQLEPRANPGAPPRLDPLFR
jgi:hypothetical protein